MLSSNKSAGGKGDRAERGLAQTPAIGAALAEKNRERIPRIHRLFKLALMDRETRPTAAADLYEL